MTAAGPPSSATPPSKGGPPGETPSSTTGWSSSSPWWGSDTGYAVKLPIFEGPLDLLLHLIRVNEVDITEIPIARVAEQYIEYLDLMRELQLDIAAEYLVMAATLAWIKSRMLLPPDPSSIAQEGLDPRAELVARLLEYQRFKEAAGEIGERSLLGRDVFAAHAPAAAPPEGERELEVGVFELVEAMRRVLSRASHTGAAHEVEVETVTVRERMLAVMEVLASREACEFEDLVREGPRSVSRPILVATFLAILELTRLEAIGLYQGVDDEGVPRGTIHVRRRGEVANQSWVERVSELM